MVLSKINDSVSYTESKTIDEDDKGRDVSMYKMQLFKIKVIIALGNIKYTYIDENILYTPVYLVINETDKIYQIGVYEIKSDEYENLLDDDNDLDITLINGPLLYSFVDKEYIEKCMLNESLVSDEDSGDETTDDELEDLDDDDDEKAKEEKKLEGEKSEEEKSKGEKDSVLIEIDINTYEDDDDFLQSGETEREDKKERQKFKKPEESDSQWIEEFMRNNNYNIIDNDGGGDCLFYTIRDAFKSIGINASVEKLRKLLSSEINKDIFQTYKERFDMYETEFKTLKRDIPKKKKKIKVIAKTYNKLAKEAKAEKDRSKQKIKIKEARKLKSEHKGEKENLNTMTKELKNVIQARGDWTWMSDIKTISDLKSKMETCDFWADGWAISTLEMILNTKIIILSSEHYRKGNYKQVLNCGEVVPKKIEDKGYFKPKYFVIVEHTGEHYKLITYKENHIYRFHQIPWGIRALIVDTCMKHKTAKTLYNYIPKFAKLINQTIDVPIGEKEDSIKDKIQDKIQDKTSGTSKTEEESEEKIEVTPSPSIDDKDLFDDNMVFVFYSKSADKPPGKGTGEKIPADKLLEFSELAKIKNWRRILSNFYTKPKEKEKVQPLFKLDGLKWASVEHYFHGNKFKKNNRDYYKLFSINSGSQIMDDPKKALGAGGKTGRVGGKKFRPRSIVIDEDFYDGNNRENVMERAQQAKYEQDELSKKVLLATKNAKLIHYVASRKPKDQRPPPVVFYDTMRIRNKLKKLDK
ncbi:MAG: hypothetical protein CL678_05740 [Bdellovibrionaceae bacterium]|nr:hypothetical protein [Pseudobdellovibrionaceae bacterium]|tara:strand:+ start:5271 stop:7523 length:2253 start_codon:yes stop_codon:yes gene_type:complete